MSSGTTLSLDQLPPEVLLVIFHHIDIPDILRIRRVSQYLNKTTYHREIWANVYRTAEFVHPPGPFTAQSTQDLEDALLTSFRIHRNISTGHGTILRKKSMLKMREIRLEPPIHPYGLRNLRVNLVFGRFLLVVLAKEVHCYDLNLDNPKLAASIIHRTTVGKLESFHCVSAIDLGGCPFACVVLSEATQAEKQILIYFLNLAEQSQLAVDLIYRFEDSGFSVYSVELGPRVIVIHGLCGGYPDERWIVLDVHTRVEFLFDTSIPPIWEATQFPHGKTPSRCISTSTHVVLLQLAGAQTTGWSTFFQAFVLPALNDCHMTTTTPITLTRSHQGIIPDVGVYFWGAVMLHDAVLDPATQDVLIAIRVVNRGSPSQRSVSQCGTLRLHTPSEDEMGIITFQPHGPFIATSAAVVRTPSLNGTGWVFYIVQNIFLSAIAYDLHVRRERETKIVDYPRILRFQGSRKILDYDPFSGRICVQDMTYERDTVIEIWNLSI